MNGARVGSFKAIWFNVILREVNMRIRVDKAEVYFKRNRNLFIRVKFNLNPPTISDLL
jgi:hypothetical protein